MPEQDMPFRVDIQDVIDSYGRQLAERANQLAMVEARNAALTREVEELRGQLARATQPKQTDANGGTAPG